MFVGFSVKVFVGLQVFYFFPIILWLLLTLREALILELEDYESRVKLLLFALTTISWVFLYIMISFPNGVMIYTIVSLGMMAFIVSIIVVAVKYEQELKEIELTRLKDALETVDETRSLTFLEVFINYPKLWAKLIKRHGTKHTALMNAIISGILSFVLLIAFLMMSLYFSLTLITYLGMLLFSVLLGAFVYQTSRKRFIKAYQRFTDEQI